MDGERTYESILIQIQQLSSQVETLSQKLDNISDVKSLSTVASTPCSAPTVPIRGSAANSFCSEDEEVDPNNIVNEDIPDATGSTVWTMPRLQDVEESERRGTWGHHLDFLFSCLTYTVSLGNIWRFPVVCARNGGGAFLVASAILLVILGIPMVCLEMYLGQFTSRGLLNCWNFAPIFKGIGYGMVLLSVIVCIYHNMIIAWSIYYICASIDWDPSGDGLRWHTCNEALSDQWYCYYNTSNVKCPDDFPELSVNLTSGMCVSKVTNNTPVVMWNTIEEAANMGVYRKFPSEQFYRNFILDISQSIDEIGQAKWQLVVCLLVAWIFVFLPFCKGIKSSGKVVYVTAIFPYLVLLTLLIKGLLLSGCYEGIHYFVNPEWDKLKDPQVWAEAAGQVFFSLYIGWGGLITLSSYCSFDNNIILDSIIVTILNYLTSLMAGFVIFSYLGHLAIGLGTTVDTLVKQRAGLAFVLIPEAFSQIDVAPVWSGLFFSMIFVLGCGTQFLIVETVITALADICPEICRSAKTLTTGAFCVASFMIGVIFCTRGGVHVLELIDKHTIGWPVLFLALSECCALMYVYGWRRISKDLGIMLGYPLRLFSPLLFVALAVLCPIIILYTLLFSWVYYPGTSYGEDYYAQYEFPQYAHIIGIVIGVLIVLPIPLCVVCQCATAKGSAIQNKKMTK